MAATDTTTSPRIDTDALAAFIAQQVEKIHATPIPPELARMADGEKLTEAETLALWYGAGVASQIGMALALEPGAYVIGFPEDMGDDDAEHAAADALNDAPDDPAPAA